MSVGKTPRMVPGERGRRGQAGMPAHISSKMSNPLWQPEPDLPEGRRCWQGSHLRCACQGGGSGGVRPPGRRPVGQIRALDGWGAGRPPAQPALPPQRLRGCGARAGQAFLLASSAAVAVRRVQTALPAASISHPLGSADTVNGPEIECKIKMQQINGCKSHLEPIIRTTSGLQSCETSAEAKLAWLRGGRGGGTPAPHPPLAQLSSH